MNEVIDHIDNIEINRDNFPIKNLQALDYLAYGIFQLVVYVKSRESEETAEFRGLFYDPDLENSFNWFAINVVAYVRLVYLIKLINENNWTIESLNKNKDKIKKRSNEYLEKVVPEVYEWRNKIAAHFAITDPRNENYATLEQSIQTNVSFNRPHFFVGSMKWNTDGTSSELPSWSMVSVFYEQLKKRYWPDVELR